MTSRKLKSLFGKEPNQSPRNSDLGQSAYWDIKPLKLLLENLGISSKGVTFKQKGEGAVERSLEKKLGEIISVSDYMSEQDLIDIASGTRSLGVREAVKKAVEKINKVGGTLYFPPGYYNSPYLTHTDENNWIRISRSGVKLIASPGSVTLENFLFYIHGTYGDIIEIGSEVITTGDKIISFGSPHNLKAGDRIQMLSSVNAGSVDAGYFQMESTNPTNLEQGILRLTEIHQVGKIINPTSIEICDSVIYPDYRDNIDGYLHPIPGVFSAGVRKLDMVDGVSFVGLGFKNEKVSSFRCILARACSNLRFQYCNFESGSFPGQHIKTTSCDVVHLFGCTSHKYLDGVSGSGWNSFMFGGGTSNIIIDSCCFAGESQTIDFTPVLFGADPGSEYEGAAKSFQLSIQNIIVTNNIFSRCNNGFTTHPGCYDVQVIGNKAIACESGFTLRSLRTKVSDNSISAYYRGISVSAFYHDLSITDNQIVRFPGSLLWSGVGIDPFSSEVMNRNDIQRVLIQGNTISDPERQGSGISIRHLSNGVAPDHFEEFTDEIKAGLSDYKVINNTFNGCGIDVNRYVNGVLIKGNVFKGGEANKRYILANFGSACVIIDDNLFMDDLAGVTISGNTTGLEYSYDSRHTLGFNKQYGESNNNSIYKSDVKQLYSIDSVSGNVAVTGDFSSGEHEAVIINIPSGITSATPGKERFMKVGNVVNVMGAVSVYPSETGMHQLRMKLPVESTLPLPVFQSVLGVCLSDRGGAQGTVSGHTSNTSHLNIVFSSVEPHVITYNYSYTVN